VYVEKARLSNSLRDLATDGERKKVVDNIETLRGKLQELNSQKEYIIQHGRLPDQPAAPAAAEAPADKEGLTRDRNNLRSQVSKARGALKKNPKDVRKQQKLAQLEADLEQVENKLRTLDA
jgi:multidrug efflux pump subunit AcrB